MPLVTASLHNNIQTSGLLQNGVQCYLVHKIERSAEGKYSDLLTFHIVTLLPYSKIY
jgi:hypothetical protein